MKELVERGDWDSLEEEWLEAISRDVLPLGTLMETIDHSAGSHCHTKTNQKLLVI